MVIKCLPSYKETKWNIAFDVFSLQNNILFYFTLFFNINSKWIDFITLVDLQNINTANSKTHNNIILIWLNYAISIQLIILNQNNYIPIVPYHLYWERKLHFNDLTDLQMTCSQTFVLFVITYFSFMFHHVMRFSKSLSIFPFL